MRLKYALPLGLGDRPKSTCTKYDATGAAGVDSSSAQRWMLACSNSTVDAL